MIQAINTFQVVCLNFQLYSTPTLMVLNTNSKKSIPWIGPKMEDSKVIPKMYLSGTDTKTNISRDRPSKIPNNLSRPMLELVNLVI